MAISLLSLSSDKIHVDSEFVSQILMAGDRMILAERELEPDLAREDPAQ
jgi:hypothetical protein